MTQTMTHYEKYAENEKNEINFERDTEECGKQWQEYEEYLNNENYKKIVEDLEPNYNKGTKTEYYKDINNRDDGYYKTIVNAFNNEIYTKWVNEYLYKLQKKLDEHYINVDMDLNDNTCNVSNEYGCIKYGDDGRFGKEMHICRKDRKRIKNYRSMSNYLNVVFFDYVKKFKFD